MAAVTLVAGLLTVLPAVAAAAAVPGAAAAPIVDATPHAAPQPTPPQTSDDPTPEDSTPVPPPEPSPSRTTESPSTPTPTPTTTTPSPTESSQLPVPPPSPTPTATPSATPGASPTATPSRSPAVLVPGSGPAVQSTDIPLVTGLVALAVLVVAALVLWLVSRSDRSSRPPAAATMPLPAVPAGAEPGLTALLIELAEAMIAAGYGVSEVQQTLMRVATARGAPGAEVIVFPTAALVSVPGETRVETAAAVVGAGSLRLEQVDAVGRASAAAADGAVSPAQSVAELRRIWAMPPAYPPLLRTAGYALLSVGLVLLLSGSLLDLLVAACLGAVVGGELLLVGRASSTVRAVVPLLSAFVVALVVFLLGRTTLDIGVLAPLIAPLVALLPGALLTTSMTELATGQLVSGAGRVAGGIMQLVLLAIGIIAAGQLVGVPASDVTSTAVRPLGDLAPWVGVAVFGIGMAVHQCAPRTTVRWILLVLYVAYAAQVIGGIFFGPVLAAFVGALVMTPVAAYVARRPTGPATQVSFLPAFWMLVPGSLGLVGVTKLLGNDRVDAGSVLVTTAITMVAISFGVLIGRALVGALPGQVARFTRSFPLPGRR